MSQLIIMRFESAGEMAGVNMAPPPESPTGTHSAGADHSPEAKLTVKMTDRKRDFMNSIDAPMRAATQNPVRTAARCPR